MKTRLLACVVMIALVLGGLQLVSAETRPTIVTFESSLAEISVDDAESAAVNATLSWHTLGVTEEYRLTLHQYLLDDWEMVYPQAGVALEPVGSRNVTIRHPLGFGPPTFLLSIVSAQSNGIVAQRILTIPYEASMAAPTIESFTADVQTVDASALAAGESRVMVKWSVLNRVPTANLVFEQVLADGSAVSVELPREHLWIPSAGEGPVAPKYQEGAEDVGLRLRIVDVVTEEVYAEEEISLLIAGTGGPLVEPVEPGAGPVEPAPPPVATGIESFTATPNIVNPGAPVTLAWRVSGTDGVTIEQRVPGRSEATTVVSAQSPQGTATVYLPDFATYNVQYTLKTTNAESSTVVQVHCPFTFFFGQGDGCPAGPMGEHGASYQAFEGGYMLWRSDTNEIYVHYNDGSAAYFLEASYAAMDEVILEDMPPLDRYAPVSGFGKVWANAPGVGEKLGWALEPEQSFNIRVQMVAPYRTPRPEFTVYLTLPNGQVVGSGYGAWRAVG